MKKNIANAKTSKAKESLEFSISKIARPPAATVGEFTIYLGWGYWRLEFPWGAAP